MDGHMDGALRDIGGEGSGHHLNSISLNSHEHSREEQVDTVNSRWGPVCMGIDMSESKEELKTEVLLKKVRRLLNEFTPQKFDVLLMQFIKLPIDSQDRLRQIVILIFSKAVDKPSLAAQYACLCWELQIFNGVFVESKSTATDGEDPSKKTPEEQPMSFRQILLTICQDEFEWILKEELNIEARKEIEACTDPEKKEVMKLIFEGEETRRRQISVGVVIFIGELYKQRMLTSKIMHSCIQSLLEKNNEESLECLCKLLTTVGKMLEESEFKVDNVKKRSIVLFNDYFARMKELAHESPDSKVSSTIRFMLQDVIELRERQWVPRPDENNQEMKDRQMSGDRSQGLSKKCWTARSSKRRNFCFNVENTGRNRVLQQLKELHTVDNRWVPVCMGTDMSKSKEELKTEVVLKKVRGILNRLTPEKFDVLLKQFMELPIDSHDGLRQTVILIFSKAVDDPTLAAELASLCSELQKRSTDFDVKSKVAVTEGGDSAEESMSCRHILETLCQDEFKRIMNEDNIDNKLNIEARNKEIEACADPEKKEEMKLIFEAEETRKRRKSVALVKFIGELYKQCVLTSKIMHSCIQSLLEKIDEESLECLCKLLTTGGKMLEESECNVDNVEKRGIVLFNEYFARMKKLAHKSPDSKVSSRIRFMLQDVIELRERQWVPRRPMFMSSTNLLMNNQGMKVKQMSGNRRQGRPSSGSTAGRAKERKKPNPEQNIDFSNTPIVVRSPEVNDDELFLESLIPSIKKIPKELKLDFRSDILDVVGKYTNFRCQHSFHDNQK